MQSVLGGRAGSGMGAVLASMRASEQIDALESLSIDSSKSHYFVDLNHQMLLRCSMINRAPRLPLRYVQIH